MAAVTSSPPFSSSATSFLALRGVAEEYLGAARAACARTPIVTLRRTARGFPSAVGRSIGPDSACGKKKKRDETGSSAVSAPLVAFDPLGSVPGTSGAGGLYLLDGGAQKNKLEATTGPRQRQRDPLPPVSAEWLDRWVRGSVTEIVKRIEEAPFLSYIFANDTDGCSCSSSSSTSSFSFTSSVRIEREVADTDDWPLIQKRWGSTSPDGVILVEELKDRIKEDFLKGIGVDGDTRTWGVLVQGRGGGADCTACYILNTCRVRSMLGCCTHFCLVRAQCYGDSAEQQLRNAWLAYGHRQWQQQ